MRQRPRTPWRRPFAGAVPVLSGLVALALACSPAAPPLTNTSDSPEALARAVLDRLAANDRAGLERLQLTRDEFERHVWPHLPASRPETNMPMSFVWGRLAQQSEARLSQVLARHGGQRYTLVSVTFHGERSQHGDVQVLRDSALTVRTPAGTTEELELFGSMIVQDGRCKVFSYVTD